MSRLLALLLLATMAFASPAFANPKALFDIAHAEDFGNADWVIDDNFPVPVPAQSGITPGSPLDYWTGAISSYGVSLVKRGYTVHSNTTPITYGNTSNVYDLANYDVFIVPEPNTLFTPAEKTAILNFVYNGGGLIAIGDHGLSDRNNDCYDSPMIWNDLDPTHLLGVHFQQGSVCGSVAEPYNSIYSPGATVSTNVATSPTDSITHGPVGVVTGLEFANGTTLTLYPATNPTVRGEVWMNGVAQTSLTQVMAASSQYGSGRVFFIGDSSPVDDGSARPGNLNIYDGWGVATATDSTLFMNATLWATRRGGGPNDMQSPSVALTSPVGGEAWKANSSHAITWTATDNVGVTGVDLAYSVDGGVSWPYTIATNLANSGSYAWTVPNTPGTQTRVMVTARDAASNAASAASPANFTIDRWAILASAGPNGTITPSGTLLQAENTNRTFTITPAANYQVASVLVDGASVGAVTTYTFTSIHADHTIAASFAPTGFTVATAATGSGSVTRSPDQPTYASGSVVQLTAVSGTGFAFTGWSGDTTGSANPFTVTVTHALSYTAAFADTAAPTVSLLSPIGGDSWAFGTTHAVTWTATDNVGVASVTIEYSATGPDGPWLPVASGLANSGSYDWTVPAPATTQAVVRVTALDATGHAASAASVTVFSILDPAAGVVPGRSVLALSRPTPNPSGDLSTIEFSLPADAHARLQVLDTGGRRVAAREGSFGAGRHIWQWDGRLASGARVPAGLYFVRLSTPYGDRLTRLVRLD
jgi:hypothetical protein